MLSSVIRNEIPTDRDAGRTEKQSPTPDVEFQLAGTKSRFIGTSFVHHEFSMTNIRRCEPRLSGQSNPCNATELPRYAYINNKKLFVVKYNPANPC
jgi:hypothetical protein